MPDVILRPSFLATIGFGYGVLLVVFGFLTLGAGHGSAVVVVASCSPLPVLLTLFGRELFDVFGMSLVWGIIIAPPALWCGVGWLLSGIRRRFVRILFLMIMIAHYGGVAWIVLGGSNSEELHRAQRPNVIGGVVISAMLYAVGQVAIWVAFFTIPRRDTLLDDELA